MESWKQIEGYPGYEVSDEGRVRSFLYRVGRGIPCRYEIGPTPSYLKLTPPDRKGYLRARLYKNGSRRLVAIGRLILSAFVGPPAFPKAEARHLDDDKSNNKMTNLRWGTAKDNWEDRRRNGHVNPPFGEGHRLSKLTEVQAREIHRRCLKYGDQTRIARELRVSESAVRNVLCGRTWRRVKEEIERTKNLGLAPERVE